MYRLFSSRERRGFFNARCVLTILWWMLAEVLLVVVSSWSPCMGRRVKRNACSRCTSSWVLVVHIGPCRNDSWDIRHDRQRARYIGDIVWEVLVLSVVQKSSALGCTSFPPGFGFWYCPIDIVGKRNGRNYIHHHSILWHLHVRIGLTGRSYQEDILPS